MAMFAWLLPAGRAETLEDAWSAALAHNQRLAAARMGQVAAAEDLGAAAAERMPNVSLYSAYTVRSDTPSFVVREPIPGFGSFQFPFANQNAASVSTDVQLPIYTGGRITNSIRSANARKTASEWDTAQVRLDLLFEVGEAYLGVLRLEREVEAARSESESLAAHAEDIARRAAEERALHGDVLAAQVAARSAQQRWSQQLRALEVARGRYNRFVGRPANSNVELVEPQLEALPYDLDQLVQVAYDRRPDLRSLMSTSDAHEYAAWSVRGSGRPQITASVGTQYEENRFTDPQTLSTAAVAVDWNLFDGGKIERLSDAERARAASIRCLAEDLKSQIAVDLLAAWNDAALAADQLQLATQTVAYATELHRTIQLRFNCGMELSAAVLDAQARLTNAQSDESHARYQRASAHLRLRYLAGILAPESTGP
jgi:outer membrane protein TolC